MNNISAEVSVKFPGILQFPRDGGKNNYQLYYYNSFLTNFKGRGVFVCLFWSFCFGLNFWHFFGVCVFHYLLLIASGPRESQTTLF